MNDATNDATNGGTDGGTVGPARPMAPWSRFAEMRRARAERAERLARLHGARATNAAAAPEADDPAALASFLQALRAAISDAPPADAATPAAAPAAALAAVLPFQRAPERRYEGRAEVVGRRPAGSPPPGDLGRLPGAGPGLVWALERVGIARLADLAASEPAPLADRLGPIGGLIDLPAWIAFARGAAEA